MTWTCTKCDYSLEISDSQRIDYCPNCGAHVHPNSAEKCSLSSAPSDFPNQVVHDIPTSRFPSTNLYEMPQRNDGAICPICCTPIENGEIQITCPDCKVTYHKECWDDNKGCATYGCKSAQCQDVHASRDTTETLTPCTW